LAMRFFAMDRVWYLGRLRKPHSQEWLCYSGIISV
jgi:hypothetical protein